MLSPPPTEQSTEHSRKTLQQDISTCHSVTATSWNWTGQGSCCCGTFTPSQSSSGRERAKDSDLHLRSEMNETHPMEDVSWGPPGPRFLHSSSDGNSSHGKEPGEALNFTVPSITQPSALSEWLPPYQSYSCPDTAGWMQGPQMRVGAGSCDSPKPMLSNLKLWWQVKVKIFNFTSQRQPPVPALQKEVFWGGRGCHPLSGATLTGVWPWAQSFLSFGFLP